MTLCCINTTLSEESGQRLIEDYDNATFATYYALYFVSRQFKCKLVQHCITSISQCQ